MSETTATRIGPLGRAVTLLALAVAWAVAAVLLWNTTVPPLDLDGFDEHRYFGERATDRAHDYSQGARAIWLLSTAATIGMLILVTLWFVALPFGLASLWWQHHWGLAPFDIFSWLVAQRYALAVGGAFAMLVIVIVVGFAARFGRLWWIAVAPVFIVLLAALVFVSGWLLAADTTAIRDPALQADVTRLARAEGVGGTPVHVQDVDDWTDQANAFAAGYGPSTNVVLWNTLLDGRFSRSEVNAVVAHELGHVKRRHVAKSLAWFALFALPAGLLVAELTRRRGGLQDPANLPYAMLVFTIIGLAAAPFQNLVSRRYEAEADWIALQTTKNPVAVKELFRGFERTSLEEPNPPLLDYVWLEGHPTIMQRIAMAERYREGRR